MNVLKYKISTLVVAMLLITNGCQRIEPDGFFNVNTGLVIDIAFTAARSGGEVTDAGGSSISARGVCWSRNTEPSIISNDGKTSDGSGKGSFTSMLTGLLSGTTYYIRAYATNNEGTTYGNDISFTTQKANAPSVTTDAATSVGENSAVLNGNVIEEGGAEVTDRGFWYSTSTDPVSSGMRIPSGSGNRGFSGTLSELESGSTYYFVAYATNSAGTGIGDVRSLTTARTTAPSVSTGAATSVSDTLAVLNGNVADEGSDAVTTRGFYYGTYPGPVDSGTKIAKDSGTGSFSSVVSDLLSGTTYYFVAYATNNAGTSFGEEKNFTTSLPISTPSVLTETATSIEKTFAILNGNVTGDGGADVTDKGFYYGASRDPETTGAMIQNGSGTGGFSSIISDLSSGTTYYFVAYATNTAGMAYGDEYDFTTLEESGETVTDIDGNKYKTILIGEQLWMKENLKVTRYANGTPIQLVEGISEWDALTTTDKAYCWFDNSTNNRDIYGGLYTFAAAMNGAVSSSANPSGIQGVCPSGWHLPSDEEWKELEMYLGMSSSEADGLDWRGTDESGKLKEAGTTHWSSPNVSASNSSGFTALPGGYRSIDGIFVDESIYARFWSATEDNSTYVWIRFLYNERASVYRNIYHRYNGFSVRCIKD